MQFVSQKVLVHCFIACFHHLSQQKFSTKFFILEDFLDLQHSLLKSDLF